jgi:hypothetical protein
MTAFRAIWRDPAVMRLLFAIAITFYLFTALESEGLLRGLWLFAAASNLILAARHD